MICEKKDVSKEVVKELCTRFGCSALTASILCRRGITKGEDIQFYLENDLRYLHNPFLMNSMEDAVDRILDAKEEGEKVLIFGDRDVDGITSTTILYRCLKNMGLDVQWKIPTGEDTYGLSIKVIEEFAANYGTLIITVDCGISNIEEIDRANELGIDVIVTDHHNPPDVLPNAAVIVNPKIQDCGYPFAHISGCAVAFKLISALRLSRTEIYKQEICLLNVRPLNEAYVIECAKMVNMTEKARLTETITPGMVKIDNTRLLPFLRGQQIFVWDADLQKKQLAKIFGNGVEFNMLDIRGEIGLEIPSVQDISLLRLKDMSRILRYNENQSTELDAFCNIFITYMQKKISNSSLNKKIQEDLQLVTLAALADIMPLQNENRILVRNGLQALNQGFVIDGLKELLARLNMLGKRITSTDLSWDVIPVLNAAGRLGKPELAVKLFLEEEPLERDKIATQIIQMNIDRRQIGNDSWSYIEKQAYENAEKNKNKLVVVLDERVHRGVCGIVATNLVKVFHAPSIVMTILEDETVVGSMRSTRGIDATSVLAQCSDLLTNYGGHNSAAGFNLIKEKVQEFISRLNSIAEIIELEEEKEELPFIDAEIPITWLNPDLIKTVDMFEPYGEKNQQLLFFTKNLKIISADVIGKGDKKHLKLTLDGGKHKWPALYWNAAEKLNNNFKVGDSIDILYQLNRNLFNGTEKVQIILENAEKTS